MTETAATEVEPRQALGVPVRAALWVASFAVVFWLCVQWTATTTLHNDFTQNVWLPSRLVLDGYNPYHPLRSQVDASLGQYSSVFAIPGPQNDFNSGDIYHFIYPIWVALALAPFAALPLATATALWRALNVLLLVWGVGKMLRSSNPAFKSLAPPAIAATGVTALLCVLPTFREGFLTLLVGQFSIIEFGLLAAIWGWLVSSASLSEQRRMMGDTLVGVALAVLATKPQAVGLPVLLLGIWALSRRRFAIPLSAAVSLAALLVIPNLIYPWSLRDWFSVMAGGQAGSQAQVSASVWGVAYHWLGGGSTWIVVSVVLGAACIVAMLPRWWSDIKDRTSPVPLSLPLTLCINSVISPYMLGYEQVVLLVPALIFLAAAGLPGSQADPRKARDSMMWRLAIYSWLAVLPLVVVVAQAALGGLEYPAIAQSLAMLALCWVGRLKWKWEKQ